MVETGLIVKSSSLPMIFLKSCRLGSSSNDSIARCEHKTNATDGAYT